MVDSHGPPQDGPGPLELSAVPQVREPKRYRILSEHGRGGLGRVSRAHDVELGRDIAIKELIAPSDLAEVRFLREALITARLEHPGIVPVYEAGRWPDGTPFYAMKLVAGRSLRELIAECATIDERIGLLDHVIAVADAIAYAHGRNIIHRDLKPSNVIVGEFGETVVIDWGLAKDLTVAEVSTVGGGPFRVSHDDSLTATGAILGTPAYMPPEQARGEQVDHRADVFAIGAMLWELCSLEKLPPAYAGRRRRILRSSGIDQDLAAIVEKCLEPDPDHRYPEAGALAADLKAFKLGARIAARRYTLLAMLGHWARRRKKLAISAAAILVFALAGVALYVRNVTAARDRADSSEATARQALDALTLQHAELLLSSDPSAAIDALAAYRGDDTGRAQQIRAEAQGRGVAIVRAMPHSRGACWVEATARGVISVGIDGTIALTASDGSSTVIARGVAELCTPAYAPERHLLAYVCDPSDICLYDVLRGAAIEKAPALRGTGAAALALSPDGTRLAWMASDSTLHVVGLGDPAHPSSVFVRPTLGGTDVKFLGNDVVVAHVSSGLEFIDMSQHSESIAAGNSYWDASAAPRRFVTISRQGEGTLLEAQPARIIARAALCPGPAAGVKFIPGREEIAYACKNGVVGVWAPGSDTVTPRIQLDGHADALEVSGAGDYLVAAGGNATVSVLDLTTNLTATYRGHKFRLTAIAAPTPEHAFVVSGDLSGAIRTWPLPSRLVSATAAVNAGLHTAAFYDGDTKVVATAFRTALTTLSPRAEIGSAEPHELYNVLLERSPDASALAAYGFNDHIELWSLPSLTRTQAIHTGQGTISQLRFADGTHDVIAAGHDGRLVRWSASGEATLLARIAQPIVGFAAAPTAGAMIIGAADGSLWRTGAAAEPIPLRGSGSPVMSLLAPPEQRAVYAGYASGDVIAIDTRSWDQRRVLHADEPVLALTSSLDGRRIAVTTHDAIYVSTLDGADPAAQPRWTQLVIRASHLAIATGGLLVALGTSGSIWLYSIPQRAWLYLAAGTADLRHVVSSAAGDRAVAVDADGRFLQLDLRAARARIDRFDVPSTHEGAH
jgi:WD40 repeat protein